MAGQRIDEVRAHAFARRFTEIINDASLALVCSVGHRTGLFDAMAKLPRCTSEELAEAAGLNERYVREWLATMTVGHIVEYDSTTKRFRLPLEHAVSVTRAAGPGNLAAITQFVSMMGNVEEQIVDSFKSGGGVPYTEYKSFHRMMGEMSSEIFDATLIDGTLPLVPGMVERLESGIDVADVGCGSGHAINLMAETFPESGFTGYDFSDEAIGAARAGAEERGLSNARFEVQDVSKLELADAFDFITAFDSVHDQAHPRTVLKNIARALRPGGTFLMVDIQADSEIHENIGHPLAAYLYAVSTLHCMTVSLALGGEGLGTMWGEQKALELLAEAGFGEVDVKRVEGNVFNSFFVCRRSG